MVAFQKLGMAIGPNRDMPRLVSQGGIFYVIFYDHSISRMRRFSLRTRDVEVAKVAFGKHLLAFPDGPMRPTLPARLTVFDALDHYLVEHVEKECADPDRQRQAVLYLKSYFRDALLEEIDITWFLGYADARRLGWVQYTPHIDARTAAESTIRRELSVLRAAARHVFRWRKIKDLPHIELPRSWDLGEDRDPKFFSREQIALLIFNAHGETRDFIKLGYFTAARRASIEKLTVQQVDFAGKRINLATPGKKRTKKRQPVVPLFDVIAGDLRRLTAGKKPTDRVLQPRSFYTHFKELCRALDFPEPHHPHMLRHSRATHLLQDGKKIYSVAALLGDTMATIERYYAHSAVAELLEALS